ncbi:glycosyltransferase family 2 protein [bacterium]|nr:glycosyltransferase family 2 protein [bacterium]
MKETGIAAVIPAYNAEKTLTQVITGLKHYASNISIIVVNDGSTDATAELCKLRSDIIHIEHEHNKGKGAALKTGIQKALSLNFPLILTLDADTQHNPIFVPKMVVCMKNKSADIVIGSRMSDVSAMPMHRIISNKLTSKLISLRVKQQILDSQSGFRLIASRVFKDLSLRCEHFDFESEFLIKSVLRGYRLEFVTVDTVYQAGQASHMKYRDVIRFIKMYFRSFSWKRSRHYESRGNC